MTFARPLCLILLLLPAPALADEPIPPPSQTPATVVVSGRTSTPREIKIAAVGDKIPTTYSGNRVKNTPGFTWYVSQHYALKTDYPEEKARFYLTLVELAYPHYVELFGKEPPDIQNKRMAIVYGSTVEQFKKALLSDGIAWNNSGGGVTYEGYNCAYQYPSGTLRYHQRYILLHECVHLFQYCLNGNVHSTPGWYYEGVADALGHHVYDERSNQLTVNVLDKAAITNYLDDGLTKHRKEPLSFSKVHKAEGSSRDVNFLMVHYLSDDPERLQKFRIWRDELFRANLYGKHQELSARLLQELYGPWDKLDADFRKWLDERRNSFHYVEWGWEQSSNTLWSYGFAGGGKLSQTNIHLPPGQKPAFDSLRLDYPAEAPPPLVGTVARGTEEPAVGCLIYFSANPRHGRAGLGLGVVTGDPRAADKDDKKKVLPGMLRVLIVNGTQLLMDGSEIGLERKETSLPEDLLKAMSAGGERIGLNAKIGAKALQVTLRAQAKGAEQPVPFEVSLALTPEARARLLAEPLALLARDGYHGLTPFCDEARRLEPDLSVPAPANRWRNPGDRPLFLLTKAGWRLGRNTPASLEKLRVTLRDAADKDTATQTEALETYRKTIAAVREDVGKCGAAAEVVEQVLADLAGER